MSEIDEAARQLAEAKLRYDRAVAAARDRERVQDTEPTGGTQGRVVRFSHRYAASGTVYRYAAMRADCRLGERRWFITANDRFPQGGHRGLRSPCTWAELVEFAIPDTIEVAPLINHWKPVRNLVRPSSVLSGKGMTRMGWMLDPS